MPKLHHPCDYDGDVNLTLMEYEQWVEWLFTTDHNEWHEFCVEDPEKLVDYATRLFTEFGKAAKPYTYEQVDRALWFLLGAQLELGH
ncbi:MAG: hypothetical protein NZ874_08265 [Fimbriimonadales bacterium]|nr:hypothetical protein [Fimbriimonadales bacterium]